MTRRSENQPASGLLETATLFGGLTSDERAQIVDAAGRRKLHPEEVLFQQDEPANSLVLVEEGHIKVSRLDPEGRRVVVRVAHSGETVGCISTISGTRYPATATVASSGSALTWSRDALNELTARIPRLTANALQMQSGYVRELIDRIHDLSLPTLAPRVARAVLRLHDRAIDQDPNASTIPYPLTRQDLAEITGTTVFSVSRVLSEWDRRGLIRSGRGTVTVLEREGLEELSAVLPE